jgi:hypothetical protein
MRPAVAPARAPRMPPFPKLDALPKRGALVALRDNWSKIAPHTFFMRRCVTLKQHNFSHK